MSGVTATVSPMRAICAGGRVLCTQVGLLAVVSFAVVCERALTLYLAWTGVPAQAYLQQYRALLVQFATHGPMGGLAELRPFAGLFGLMAMLGGLLLLGGFLMTGVLGLMRDLFLREGYDLSMIAARGARYFWPVVRFKLPVYALLSVWGAALLPLAAWLVFAPGGPRALATALMLLGVVPFFAARVLLSLGSKWIVVHETQRVWPLYGQIWWLVLPFLGPVTRFYAVMLSLGAAVVALPWMLAKLGVGTIWIMAVPSAASAAFAVWARASALSMYLQLAEAAGGLATEQHRFISPKSLRAKG